MLRYSSRVGLPPTLYARAWSRSRRARVGAGGTLLAVLGGVHRPEHVGPVHDRGRRQRVDRPLPDLELVIGGRPERDVDLENLVGGVAAEHAGVKDGVHPELGELLPQPDDGRVVRVPSGRDEFAGAPQPELVVAALGLLYVEVHGALEVAVSEGGHGVEGAEAEEAFGGGAADVGSVVVVDTDVLHAVRGDLMGPDVEHRGEDEGLFHPDRVEALEDALCALLTGEVRVGASRTFSTLYTTSKSLRPYGKARLLPLL